MSRIKWPGGNRFAFSIFDDTDAATLQNVGPVYSLLSDLGFRTTKSCWPLRGDPDKGTYPAQTCEHPEYRQWLLELQSRGFEIGWHNSTWHGVPRNRILAALDRFAEIFGHHPKTGANHSRGEGIYSGTSRVSNLNAVLYSILTRFREYRRHRGHAENSEFFWGDLCRERIKYFRNFVFADIDTLKACPIMPYHDRQRPYVNYWFASSEGPEVGSFCRCVAEEDQDRLEEEGGACIMYTHFASGFCRNGTIDGRFKRLMERLAAKEGWFVPVATLLDLILQQRGHHDITRRQRAALERKWLFHKLRTGTT